MVLMTMFYYNMVMMFSGTSGSDSELSQPVDERVGGRWSSAVGIPTFGRETNDNGSTPWQTTLMGGAMQRLGERSQKRKVLLQTVHKGSRL